MAQVARPQAPCARMSSRRVLSWFAAGAALSFVVSFVGADILELHHDLYYLVDLTVMGTFLASFLVRVRRQLFPMFRSAMPWSLVLGAVVAGALVQTVLRDPSTSHPSGAYYGFELAWRGIAYGTMDALVLFVFPAAAAFLLMHGDRTDIPRKVAFGALTLALSLAITAAYHLGYAQFRGSDLVKPEVGAVVANVPAVLTGNPVGAIVAHDVFHVTANVHAYRSGVFLPPDLKGYEERGSGSAGWALAGAWIAFAGAVMWWQRRRLFVPSAS
jgi:hypothetical protein